MAVLEGLKPEKVFEYFEKICAIPHGSGNTKEISDMLCSFAKERGLWYYQDEVNNVIIKKDGCLGKENSAPVILQGHMDMVCEKAPDCTLNMEKEGLNLKTDGEIVFAEGTTLGADNGIALAMIMAILDADDIPHPPIEAVITVDEEIGLIGAGEIDASLLKGKRMINIDSEEEGVFTVSCAGGIRAKCTFPIKREDRKAKSYIIEVGGLIGGHSGAEIDKGRANSSILLGRVLKTLSEETEVSLISVEGGLKDNAIPRFSVAKVCALDEAVLSSVCKRMDKIFKNEYAASDGEVFVSYKNGEDEIPMDSESTNRIINSLCIFPNGVMEMSHQIEGLVQTSLNLGILATEEDKVVADFGVRSSIDSQKEMLCQRLSAITESLGGEMELSGNYPGWEYRIDSPLRDLMTEVFKDQYGKYPKIEAIHAGLECGVFAGKIDDFEAISIGPDMKDIHTFSERLYIKSTERTYNLILETLKRM
ncbi:MAG: aminoacyl-histidine dipeptidase [Clostridia bacterium]|nr:aminoacyl-histidine dipeptidase [Clostridia bacterium]